MGMRSTGNFPARFRTSGFAPCWRSLAVTFHLDIRQTIHVSPERLKRRRMFGQMLECMLRLTQTLHVHVASNTQKILSSDWPKWHCMLWRCLIFHLLSHQTWTRAPHVGALYARRMSHSIKYWWKLYLSLTSAFTCSSTDCDQSSYEVEWLSLINFSRYWADTVFA